ncbi:MAG: uracil-DNA glycosylase family protein [Desulfococcaceae bacterium]
MPFSKLIDDWLEELEPLQFGPPVTHVYNPLGYARQPHDRYLERYGRPPKSIVLLGMNPGPWGMAQTGVPFGEVSTVRKWLKIEGRVGAPDTPHPARPVMGFSCDRSEVSGRRLWGWAEERFGTPERFFARFFVANYCPLLFLEESGRNRTPDRLPASEKKPLFSVCDRALRAWAEALSPEWVIGVGRFAADRARSALSGFDLRIGRVSHPSPANPRANKDWGRLAESELAELGISLFKDGESG